MSGIISSFKNIGSNVEERKVTENVRSAGIDVKDGDVVYNISAIANKRCRVVIDCPAAQRLADAIKKVLAPSKQVYDNAVNAKIKTLKNDAASLVEGKVDTLTAFLSKIKNVSDELAKLKTVRDKKAKEDIKDVDIKCQIFVKGVHDPLVGSIIKINIAGKNVDVKYKNDKKDETLYNVEINKLCIEDKGNNCKLTGGATVEGNGEAPDEKKNYVDICE
ncbi:MAG: hypothetical protein Harvfovirus85_2 [Harvfovirus sp.]|uniref:Uncharacterized protein n=1 Tax=Harvfovirus sp. TaxID=2487768 RepID=A0A3G5A805_9VIRU|nr:MAG: hypothetical protein Harvfovirus85_2 [Harvfovirus sp.]